ncbi:uncharacterized protein VP01_3117g5 [Puccinia sorghi]|uniref:DUF6589 domain-containing protein n=1 Tax=Puccinia sorghi TaxID=27349 RepID=A0A0L6UZB5_9BASI|nr:uncharacterized protein VP01_3117g5 [Puccinia sorghi]
MLISPSGQPDHCVVKDFFLETQNYCLKYFYNHNGQGTKIMRLVESISINVPLVSTYLSFLFDSFEQSNSDIFHE